MPWVLFEESVGVVSLALRVEWERFKELSESFLCVSGGTSESKAAFFKYQLPLVWTISAARTAPSRLAAVSWVRVFAGGCKAAPEDAP